jgi:hypothetical protein
MNFYLNPDSPWFSRPKSLRANLFNIFNNFYLFHFRLDSKILVAYSFIYDLMLAEVSVLKIKICSKLVLS